MNFFITSIFLKILNFYSNVSNILYLLITILIFVVIEEGLKEKFSIYCMAKFEYCYRKFEKYLNDHSRYMITPRCYNNICNKNERQDNCVFNKLLIIYNNIDKYECPHHLIDILIKYCNYKNLFKIIEMKRELYICKEKYKKILMDVIYKTGKNEYTALFKNIRSSESGCCITNYRWLCYYECGNYVKLKSDELDNIYKKEKEIINFLKEEIPRQLFRNINFGEKKESYKQLFRSKKYKTNVYRRLITRLKIINNIPWGIHKY